MNTIEKAPRGSSEVFFEGALRPVTQLKSVFKAEHSLEKSKKQKITAEQREARKLLAKEPTSQRLTIRRQLEKDREKALKMMLSVDRMNKKIREEHRDFLKITDHSVEREIDRLTQLAGLF